MVGWVKRQQHQLQPVLYLKRQLLKHALDKSV